MNLFLALFWLVCAGVLLAYEHFMSVTRFRLHVGGYSFSYAWLMLALVLYNLKRWRSERAKQRPRETARVQSGWERRRRSPAPAGPPDPNFNFTDEPPSSSPRGITDQPPPSR